MAFSLSATNEMPLTTQLSGEYLNQLGILPGINTVMFSLRVVSHCCLLSRQLLKQPIWEGAISHYDKTRQWQAEHSQLGLQANLQMPYQEVSWLLQLSLHWPFPV